MAKVRYFFYVTALSAGLGVATLAGAQVPYLVDLNSKTAIRLGNFGPGQSEVHALNDDGQVVGKASVSNVATHAFITGPDGVGMRDLGTLGDLSSMAYGINDAGQVAGESQPGGHFHAFITGPDGMGMRDLGTLGGDFSAAYGINDVRQVVGSSERTNHFSSHAFITWPDGIGMRDLGTVVLSSQVFNLHCASMPNLGSTQTFICAVDRKWAQLETRPALTIRHCRLR
jgi:probable HAF family extracellular repeat protein